MKKSKLAGLIVLFCFGVALIIDQQTVQSGAKEGIELCINTLIPSLFPFMVLTTALLKITETVNLPSLRSGTKRTDQISVLKRIFLIGLLGGYPIGATLISTCYHNKTIDKSTAKRLLGFCNNAGPAFIFGVISHAFSSMWVVIAIWIIHILSAYFTGVILLRKESIKAASNPTMEAKRNTDVIKQCVQTMGIICGWVILFRIAIALISKLTPATITVPWKVILSGILELANGCVQLNSISNQALRFLICNCIIASGGLCVMMQTASVSNSIGLHYYFPGKIIQTAISAILSLSIQWILFDDPITLTTTLIFSSICITAIIFMSLIIYLKNYSRFYRQITI